MPRDILFVLSPDFEDPALPNRRFFCPESAMLQGLLADAMPPGLDLVRLPFERPRTALLPHVGEGDQSLPLLVLADGQLIRGGQAIAQVLAERHRTPEPHP